MRARTRKPLAYTKRGLPVPNEVRMHRIEMVRRKQMRRQYANDLAALRAEHEQSLWEMRNEGAIEDEEIPSILAQIKSMPLPSEQTMAPNKHGKMKRVPLRKEYPSG